MRFPWVSRAEHERLCQRAVAEENARVIAHEAFKAEFWETRWNELREVVETQEANYADLLEKYHALKLSGAGELEPKGAPVPRPEPDPVIQAIIAKSKGSQLLRKHYNDFVREQRAMGTDESEIAAAIMAGHSLVDDGIPGWPDIGRTP